MIWNFLVALVCLVSRIQGYARSFLTPAGPDGHFFVDFASTEADPGYTQNRLSFSYGKIALTNPRLQ